LARPRVLLADDHAAFLTFVAELLEAEFEVVQTFDSGQSMIDSGLTSQAELVVLDISMPDLSGLDVAVRLQEIGCNAGIVFLTVHADQDYLQSAWQVGARGYVVKQRLATDLVPALRAALAGQRFVSPTLAAASTNQGLRGFSSN
jgi:DNA-binding NarL/FixJ family response regulator